QQQREYPGQRRLRRRLIFWLRFETVARSRQPQGPASSTLDADLGDVMVGHPAMRRAGLSEAQGRRLRLGAGVMRNGVRSIVASGKICKVLLLAVATMAIAIPGRNVALGQTGPGSNPLSNPYAFTTIDVPGVFDTEPHGINGAGQIVGAFKDTGGVSHGFLR